MSSHKDKPEGVGRGIAQDGAHTKTPKGFHVPKDVNGGAYIKTPPKPTGGSGKPTKEG